MDATTFATKTVGTNGLELVTHTIDDTLQVDSNFATEYRYRGGDSVVKNYVTFNNETWRIIGIIPTEDTSGNIENRFKIIKDESIGNYAWNSNNTNNWISATLNKYLNYNYYNELSTDAKNMIERAKYYLGGYNTFPNVTSDAMWQYERKNDDNRTGYYYGTNPVMSNDASKSIALMYASDYGYSASKECKETLYNYINDVLCKTINNWLDKSENTLLISQSSSASYSVLYVDSSGSVSMGYVTSSEYGVEPTLTLSSGVKISGGNGTSEKPYDLEGPETISFSIDNKTYYANNGMTWEEWINSEYNTIKTIKISGSKIIIPKVMGSCYLIYGGNSQNMVLATSVIEARNDYTFFEAGSN